MNTKWKRSINETKEDTSRATVEKRIKYSKDDNGTHQSIDITVNSVPSHPSCSYATVNSCKAVNSTTITLVKFNYEGCENKFHHIYQAEYSSASD